MSRDCLSMALQINYILPEADRNVNVSHGKRLKVGFIWGHPYTFYNHTINQVHKTGPPIKCQGIFPEIDRPLEWKERHYE